VNLSFSAAGEDPQLAYQVARDGLELVRRFGMRGWFYMLGNAAELAIRMGDWDWALAEAEEAAANHADLTASMRRDEIRGLRGIDVADELRALTDSTADITEVQAIATINEVRAKVALGLGDDAEALALARRSYESNVAPDATATQTAIRAAGRLGDREAVKHALAVAAGQPGRVPAAIRREGGAVAAALDGRRGEALAGFIDAIRRWRELGFEFEAAECSLGMVALLGAAEPETRVAAEYAGSVFERVGAEPFAARLTEALEAGKPAPAQRAGPSRDATSTSSAARAE
jgi:hypothetical protein